MRAGFAQGGLIPLLFSVIVNDIAASSLHVEFALYAEDMDTIAKT
jgi:hypothetical protein